MSKRPVDYYRAAKCPKCGYFMRRDGVSWRCVNPKCSVIKVPAPA